MVEMPVRIAATANAACNFFRCVNIGRNGYQTFYSVIVYLLSIAINRMWNRITRSVWANIVFAVLAAACLAGALSLIRSAAQVLRDSAAARARFADLTAEKERLEEEIYERTQESAIRYQAKARLNLKNPGEEVVIVVSEDEPADTAEPSDFWQKIREFFSKMF